ncbi:MAG: hypothetical protein COA88_10045 [Kordia sp.]|nr:MAG: hypothetical protein COA88_10045 [Kordia sp.]
MSKPFISSLQSTLEKALVLLENLPEPVYVDDSVGPFYSSIGGHIRHILDFYFSIFKGLNNYLIDLTDRERNNAIEIDVYFAKTEIKKVLLELDSYSGYDLEEKYELIDDLGQGKMSIPTNLYAVFAQANSHTIHHYAIISQLLFAFEIVIEDKTFGYNPTTPAKVIKNTSR